MLKWLWISLVVVILDQYTKYLASEQLVLHQPVPIMPLLNFTLMHNEGAAFSFLSDAGGWQRWFFTVVALILGVVIFFWIKKLGKTALWRTIALCLILGGAIGNVWDRIQLGYVVDFIQVYYRSWAWPTFNVADSAISIGVVMIVLEMIREMRQEHKQSKLGT